MLAVAGGAIGQRGGRRFRRWPQMALVVFAEVRGEGSPLRAGRAKCQGQAEAIADWPDQISVRAGLRPASVGPNSDP